MKDKRNFNKSAFFQRQAEAERKRKLINTATIIAGGICAHKKSWELCKEDLARASVELAQEIINAVEETKEKN